MMGLVMMLSSEAEEDADVNDVEQESTERGCANGGFRKSTIYCSQ